MCIQIVPASHPFILHSAVARTILISHTVPGEPAFESAVPRLGIFGIVVDRRHALKRLFHQGKAAFRYTQKVYPDSENALGASTMAAITPITSTDLEFDNGCFDSAAFAANTLSNWHALAAVIDHTLLKPDATRDQVE